jgi:hypothetical protein
MKKEYDFRYGRRGAVLREPPGKTRITIRIDDDILQWFRQQVHKAGGGTYQTLINSALRSFAESTEQSLEDTVRRVLREELPAYRVSRQRLKEGAIRRADRDRAIAAGERSERKRNISQPKRRSQSSRG